MCSHHSDTFAGDAAPGGTACIVHASCVAFSGRAVLIRGPSGSGKSSLALQMMALGAELVADDRTRLIRSGTRLIAKAPQRIRGMIEARGIGLLGADTISEAPVRLVVDLGDVEAGRLPPRKETEILGLCLPLLHKVESPVFPAALMQYLKAGLRE